MCVCVCVCMCVCVCVHVHAYTHSNLFISHVLLRLLFMYCLHRAQISCMSFSPEDTYLAMSSCTDTVHIFRLSEPQEEK